MKSISEVPIETQAFKFMDCDKKAMDKGLPPINQPITHQPLRENDTPDKEKPEVTKSLPEPEKQHRQKTIPGRAVLIKDLTPNMKSSAETTTKPSKDTSDSKEAAVPELTHSSETGRQRILSSLPYPWQPIVAGDLTSVNEVQLNQKYQGILDNYQSLGMQEGLTQLSNDLELTRSIAEQLASNNDFGLCSLLTDGLNRFAPIQDFWEHSLQCSNTVRTYSSSHPQHQLISSSALPEKGAQAAQQEAIREEFNQDFHRNLEITAYTN